MESFTKPTKIIVIIQMCLAFTLLSWHIGYPFTAKLFEIKSKKQLVKTIMGTAKEISNEHSNKHSEKLDRNKIRFEKLPLNHQLSLYRYLDDLEHSLHHSFLKKLLKSIHIITFEISPIEQMWIVFSILIPILFLLNFEGAKQTAFLLPVITFCFCLDNHWNGYQNPSKEQFLFPSEADIVTKYLNEPLSKSISKQKEQLLQGWHLFLIKNWTKEIPSNQPSIKKMQIEKGEFQFQVAQALSQAFQPPNTDMLRFKSKQPLTLLALYFIWNLFFAFFVNWKGRQAPYFNLNPPKPLLSRNA